MNSPVRALAASYFKDKHGNFVYKIYGNNSEGSLPCSISIYKTVKNPSGDILVNNCVEIAHKKINGKFIPSLKKIQDYLGTLNERGFRILPLPEIKYLKGKTELQLY